MSPILANFKSVFFHRESLKVRLIIKIYAIDRNFMNNSKKILHNMKKIAIIVL